MSGTVHSGAAPLFDISRVTVSGTVHSGAAPLLDISRVTVSGTVHSGAAPLFDISRVTVLTLEDVLEDNNDTVNIGGHTRRSQ